MHYTNSGYHLLSDSHRRGAAGVPVPVMHRYAFPSPRARLVPVVMRNFYSRNPLFFMKLFLVLFYSNAQIYISKTVMHHSFSNVGDALHY